MSNLNYEIKIVYSLRLHLALQKIGFRSLTEMKNPTNPHFNCWVYERTDEFMSAFDSLLKEDQKNG